MKPHLVRSLIGPDLDVLDETDPEELSTALSAEAAAQLTTMMEAVVADGTGTRAQIDGVRVAGKTGSAQSVEGRDPYAWFIGFAPADQPRVAVAVLIEGGGSEATGGRVAAPIARSIMAAALARQEAAS
jgi:peptidoglycan glycosyltransferase